MFYNINVVRPLDRCFYTSCNAFFVFKTAFDLTVGAPSNLRAKQGRKKLELLYAELLDSVPCVF